MLTVLSFFSFVVVVIVISVLVPPSLLVTIEFLQDQVASLKDRLSRYEAVEEDDSVNSEVFMTKSKKSRISSNNNGSSFQPSNNCSSSSRSALTSPYIEPAVFIGRPQLAFRIALFAGA